jgi:hypothetical protein
VDLAEGQNERFVNLCRALNAAVTGARGLRFIKLLAGKGVGEFGQGAALVDLGLGSLGLQVAQDSSKLGDLLFIQVELVSQESQWAANAEAGPAIGPIMVVMLEAVTRHETTSPLATIVLSGMLMMFVALGPCGELEGKYGSVTARSAPRGVAHNSLLLAEAIRTRRGHNAWATCLTLNRMIGVADREINRGAVLQR